MCEYDDFDDCEFCGQKQGMVPGCPNCCGAIFSPGSEECEWCEHSAICAEQNI